MFAWDIPLLPLISSSVSKARERTPLPFGRFTGDLRHLFSTHIISEVEMAMS